MLVERVEVEVQRGPFVAREARDRRIHAAGLVVLENAYSSGGVVEVVVL